jgi:hypothetical protein
MDQDKRRRRECRVLDSPFAELYRTEPACYRILSEYLAGVVAWDAAIESLAVALALELVMTREIAAKAHQQPPTVVTILAK